MRAKPLAAALLCALPTLTLCAAPNHRPRPPSEHTPTTLEALDRVTWLDAVEERASRSRYSLTVTTTTSISAAKPEQAPIRPREAPHSPPTAPKPATTVTVAPGRCGGWETLVARYFPANEVGNACRRILCESGGRADARNGRYVGLLQVGGGSTDAATNLAQAAAMHAARGWAPWACR